jgi:hypothetical protein
MQRKPLTARQFWFIFGSSGLAGLTASVVHTLYFPMLSLTEFLLVALAIGGAVGMLSGLLAKWRRWV